MYTFSPQQLSQDSLIQSHTHIQHVRASANQASLTYVASDPLSIILLRRGDLSPPWL